MSALSKTIRLKMNKGKLEILLDKKGRYIDLLMKVIDRLMHEKEIEDAIG